MITVGELVSRYKKGERDFSNIDIKNVNLSALNLRNIILRNCDLTNVNFENTDLTDADFSGSIMIRCILDKCILRNTNFNNCDMYGASLKDSIIENTTFRKARLMFAHLCGNDMLKSDLTDALMEWTCLIGSSLTDEQIKKIPENAITGGTGKVDTYSSRIDEKRTGYGAFSEPSGYSTTIEETVTYGAVSEIRNKRSIESYSKGEEASHGTGYGAKDQPKALEKKDLRKGPLELFGK